MSYEPILALTRPGWTSIAARRQPALLLPEIFILERPIDEQTSALTRPGWTSLATHGDNPLGYAVRGMPWSRLPANLAAH